MTPAASALLGLYLRLRDFLEVRYIQVWKVSIAGSRGLMFRIAPGKYIQVLYWPFHIAKRYTLKTPQKYILEDIERWKTSENVETQHGHR